jgi:hypothetical protein
MGVKVMGLPVEAEVNRLCAEDNADVPDLFFG